MSEFYEGQQLVGMDLQSSTSLFDLPALEQHAPNGVAVKALRPLRGRAAPEP